MLDLETAQLLVPDVLKMRVCISPPSLGNKPPPNLVACNNKHLCPHTVAGQEHGGNLGGRLWLGVPHQVAVKLLARGAAISVLDWGQNPLVGSCLWLVAVSHWLLARDLYSSPWWSLHRLPECLHYGTAGSLQTERSKRERQRIHPRRKPKCFIT